MADEENEDLTSLTPMERARKVAGNVMQYIRDNPRQGYGGTAGVSMEDAGMAGELLDNTAEAREFAESPGMGTGAMAALGMFGIPAKEMSGLAKLVGKKVDDMTDVDLYEALQKYKPMTDARLGELKKAAQDKLSTLFGSDFRPLSMTARFRSGIDRSDFESVPEYNAWRKQTDTELMLSDTQNRLEDKLGHTARIQESLHNSRARDARIYEAIKRGEPTPELGEVNRFTTPERLEKRRADFVTSMDRRRDIDKPSRADKRYDEIRLANAKKTTDFLESHGFDLGGFDMSPERRADMVNYYIVHPDRSVTAFIRKGGEDYDGHVARTFREFDLNELKDFMGY